MKRKVLVIGFQDNDTREFSEVYGAYAEHFQRNGTASKWDIIVVAHLDDIGKTTREERYHLALVDKEYLGYDLPINSDKIVYSTMTDVRNQLKKLEDRRSRKLADC